MNEVIADTHALIWFISSDSQLSNTGLRRLELAIVTKGSFYISSISIVEMIYLVEKKRVQATVLLNLFAELAKSNSAISVLTLNMAVAQAVENVPRNLVPDMPDRIIAATALHLNLPLVTRDAKLQNFPQLTTIW